MDPASSTMKENSNNNSPTSTPRQRPQRVKMPSDISGMFCPHENMSTPFSTPPSFLTLVSITRRSTMSVMPLAPSLSGSERSIPESRGDKCAPVATEEQGLLSASRKLRRMKRQLLLDSVVKSTTDQMAALQLQNSFRDRSLSFDSSLSERGNDGAGMYS
jgi:hypothetical protein